MDIISYILSKKYTDKSLVGAGALKGANCTIQSIEPISGGHRITFKWILNDDTVETDTMDVMDGNDGLGIKSIDINSNNHLIVTYDDNTTHDAGLIEGDGSTVTYTQTLQSGTKIGEITIDGTPTNIYAPSGGGGGGSTVVVTPLLSTGTKIAEIDVDGDTTNLFAPNSAEEKKCVISIVDDDGTNRTSDYYTGILSYLNGKGIPLTLAVPVDAPSKSSGTYNLTQLHDIVNAGNEVVMHGQTSTDTTRTQTLAEFQTCVDSSVTWAETNNFTSNIYVYPGGTQPNLDSAFNDKLAYLKNNSIRAAYNVNTSVENHETTGFEDWYTYMNGVDYNGVSNRIPFVTMPNGNNKTLLLNRNELKRDRITKNWWKEQIYSCIERKDHIVLYMHSFSSEWQTAGEEGKTTTQLFEEFIDSLIATYGDKILWKTLSDALDYYDTLALNVSDTKTVIKDSVKVTQTLSSGTKIGSISVDGTNTDLFAPSGGSGATSLSGLSDVELSQTIIDGHALRYDSTSGKWQNAPISPKVESRVELPTTITLEPNRVYIWFQPTVELDISLNVNHNRVFAEEFHFMFLSSSTPTELSLPSDVITPDDFSIEANKVYEISILDSLLLYNSWTIPEQEEEP